MSQAAHLIGIYGHATAGHELHDEGVAQLLPAMNFTVQHPAERVALQQEAGSAAGVPASNKSYMTLVHLPHPSKRDPSQKLKTGSEACLIANWHTTARSSKSTALAEATASIDLGDSSR